MIPAAHQCPGSQGSWADMVSLKGSSIAASPSYNSPRGVVAAVTVAAVTVVAVAMVVVVTVGVMTVVAVEMVVGGGHVGLIQPAFFFK